MPALFDGWLDRGRVLQRLGRSAESIQVIDQAIARNRNSAEAWTIRAEATWALERYEQAIVALEKKRCRLTQNIPRPKNSAKGLGKNWAVSRTVCGIIIIILCCTDML